MKNITLLLLLSLAFNLLHAQTDSLKIIKLEEDMSSLRQDLSNAVEENNSLRKENSNLTYNLNALKKDYSSHKITTQNQLDSIKSDIQDNKLNIEDTEKELGTKIDNSEKSLNQDLSNLNDSLSKNTLYWIIAILVVTIAVLVVFLILRKQIFKQKSDIISNIQNTRTILEEEGIKLDNKLIEVLESQLKIIQSNKTDENSEKENDHTLALKVADEIVRIQKNLSRMDENTKGLKQLSASVKRIQDNFASNGYEVVKMLGERFNEGMKASVTFIPDENLQKGEQIITKIIKPQVNFQGVMIQTAQIEVSQGE